MKKGARIVKNLEAKPQHLKVVHKKEVFVSVRYCKTKKPNSAQRHIAKVRLCNGRDLLLIFRFRSKFSKNNEVLVRGGRVPDLQVFDIIF